MEWQPIETAPRDGTQVLFGCFKVSVGSESKLGRMVVDSWKAEFKAPGKFNCKHWPATHWMPLPMPPEEV